MERLNQNLERLAESYPVNKSLKNKRVKNTPGLYPKNKSTRRNNNNNKSKKNEISKKVKNISCLNNYYVFNLKRSNSGLGNHSKFFYGNAQHGFDKEMRLISKEYWSTYHRDPSCRDFLEKLITITCPWKKISDFINISNKFNLLNIIIEWGTNEGFSYWNEIDIKICLILETDIFLTKDGITISQIENALKSLRLISSAFPNKLFVISEPAILEISSKKTYYQFLKKYCLPNTLYLKLDKNFEEIWTQEKNNYIDDERLIIKIPSLSGDDGVTLKLTNSNIKNALHNPDWSYIRGNEEYFGIKKQTILSKLKKIKRSGVKEVIIQPMLDLETLLEYKFLIINGEITDILLSYKPPANALQGHLIWSLTAYNKNPEVYTDYLMGAYKREKFRNIINSQTEIANAFLHKAIEKLQNILVDLEIWMRNNYPSSFPLPIFMRIDLFLNEDEEIYLNEIEPWACGKFGGLHSIGDQSIENSSGKNRINIKNDSQLFNKLVQETYDRSTSKFIKAIEDRCQFLESNILLEDSNNN